MKKFILPFFIFSFILFGSSLGLIIAIDPYDKLGINLFGFETKAVASSRDNKFYMLERSKEQYEAFIIGSSTAHRYHTNDLERLSGLKSFNYAVQHTTPEDYVAIINHIRSKMKPKLIILQIAFVDLDETYKTDKALYNSPLKEYLENKTNQNTYMNADVFTNNYITLEAIRDSIRVVFTNLFGEARHQYLEHGNYRPEKVIDSPIEVVQFSHYNWLLDEKRVQILKKIQNDCDEANIDLVVISSPLSISHYERIQNDLHMKKSFEIYKKTISGIFKNLHDFSTSEMQNYNSSQYFINSTHPTQTLSRLVLEKIWEKK